MHSWDSLHRPYHLVRRKVDDREEDVEPRCLLDADDVEPDEDLLAEYVSAIRSDGGNHAGFVGLVLEGRGVLRAHMPVRFASGRRRCPD